MPVHPSVCLSVSHMYAVLLTRMFQRAFTFLSSVSNQCLFGKKSSSSWNIGACINLLQWSFPCLITMCYPCQRPLAEQLSYFTQQRLGLIKHASNGCSGINRGFANGSSHDKILIITQLNYSVRTVTVYWPMVTTAPERCQKLRWCDNCVNGCCSWHTRTHESEQVVADCKGTRCITAVSQVFENKKKIFVVSPPRWQYDMNMGWCKLCPVTRNRYVC